MSFFKETMKTPGTTQGKKSTRHYTVLDAVPVSSRGKTGSLRQNDWVIVRGIMSETTGQTTSEGKYVCRRVS